MRSHARPLRGHPQLEIVHTPLTERQGDAVIEYRVYNFRRQNDGTVLRGDGFSWLDLVWMAALGLAWSRFELHIQFWQALHEKHLSPQFLSWLILTLTLVLRTCRTVLHESMIAIPNLGVQLQTTRGISLSTPFLASTNAYRSQIALSTSSAFIPLEQVSTIVIHEGLRRWRVEYYLAVIKRSGSGISVGFSNTRPPVAVLREVYHGLRETLFDEFDDHENR